MENFISYLAEVFLDSLPQDFALVLGIYTFNKQKIYVKKFWICMLISLISILLIRRLPISFGIHTLLSMIVLIFLGVYYLQFTIHKTIKSVLFTFLINLSIEIISMKIFTSVYGTEGFKAIMADPLKNALAGFPASLILLIIIFVLYIILTNHIKKDDSDGAISEPIS